MHRGATAMVTLGIAAGAAFHRGGGQLIQPPAADSTTVVLLGTGTPSPDPAAFGPSTAVVVGSRVFLFDAGVGVERRLAAAHLPASGPTATFITHLHSDHTLGLPDLILTSWIARRRVPLQLYGPHGLKRMVDDILDAWSEDIAIRVNGLEHELPDVYRAQVHEIVPGVVYDSGGVRVTAIPVRHGDWKEAYGYRIDTPTRSIVLSGDTRPDDSLDAASRHVDVLIHEVYPASRVAAEARPGGADWPAYLRAFHTSDVELGAIAARAQPRLLILNHIVRMGASDSELIAGIRRGGYRGKVVVGRDLDRYNP
ncbi:MAG TPA: MBL fold metallo-hydrolase [Gemmatimonadales bacterium]